MPIHFRIVAAVLVAALSTPLGAAPVSAGCGAALPANGTHTLLHGGLSRSYRLQLPAGFDNQHPARLVVMFHGWGGNENDFLDDPAVVAEASARGYVLVAPRGLGAGAPDHSNNSWRFRGSDTGRDGDGRNPQVPRDTAATCRPKGTSDYTYGSCRAVATNTCSWTHCQDDDVDFAVSLVREAARHLCIDERNVFAMGGSNGGMFTWELGQNPASAPVFRALAPLIGLPHRGYLAGPGKAGDLPVLLITGTQDLTVPPGAWGDTGFTTSSDGGHYFYASASAITQVWAAAHACDVARAPRPFKDGYPQTECRSWCGQDAGWPRVLDCRAAMGHQYALTWSWPLMLDFFDHHAID